MPEGGDSYCDAAIRQHDSERVAIVIPARRRRLADKDRCGVLLELGYEHLRRRPRAPPGEHIQATWHVVLRLDQRKENELVEATIPPAVETKIQDKPLRASGVRRRN